MQSRQLKLGALSLLIAWGALVLISVAGHLRWDNKLLWVPPGLMTASFILAEASCDYEDRRAPVLAVVLSAIASIMLYALIYAFLFLYSIPNRPA